VINPDAIPQFTGHLDQLESDIADLKSDAGNITKTGADVHASFQGLSAFYHAPEAEQLFATTKPVADTAKTFGDDLQWVTSALSEYAGEVRPIAAKLKSLKDQAATFVADTQHDHDWQYNADKVARDNDLRHQVDVAVAAFWDAERRCANKIEAIFCGTGFVANDGTNKPNMYGYSAQQLDGAKGLPWGDAVEQEHHWYEFGHWAKSFFWNGLIVDFLWHGVIVDGAWGTLKGLWGLANFTDWDTFSKSWKGLGEIAIGAASYGAGNPLLTAVGTAVPDSWLPGWLQHDRKMAREAGKSMLAWDEWSKNPARAAGGVTFNVVTALATEGAGGAAADAGKAGDIAKAVGVAGKVGRVIDPMTYVLKGAGATFKGVIAIPKVADALGALKNLKVINVKGIGNLDNLRLHGTELPDGTVKLPDGSILHPNGDLHLPDGEINKPPVELPAHVHAEVPAPREPVGAHVGGSHDLASNGGGHEPPSNAVAKTHQEVHNSAGSGHDTDTTQHTPAHASGSDLPSADGHPITSGPGHDVPGQRGHGGSTGGEGHQGGHGTEQDPREIVRKQVERANTDPEWFKKHYWANEGHGNDGYRKSINGVDEDGHPLPQLKLNKVDPENGKWIAAQDAPPAVPPKFKHPDPIVSHRPPEGHGHLNKLDEAATRRDRAISADQAAEKHQTAAELAHEHAKKTNDANAITEAQAKAEQAKLVHSPLHAEMNKASEIYGDKAAEYHAVPDHYPDAERVDNRGAGNNRFDQIWRREDGTYVVVEAKGGPHAKLGDRDGWTGRRVRQGTREYFETILDKMEERGLHDPDEAELAEKLHEALKEGKVDYVVIRAKAEGSRYAGYTLKHFDIS
jgi:hypothetical protein